MSLNIEITDFTKDVKGFKIATCDVEIKYSEEKWRKFNRLSVFHKNGKSWISVPKYMDKEGKWKPFYEMDTKSFNAIFPQILEKLEKEYI